MSGRLRPGRYQAVWDGTIGGRKAPTGVYLIRYWTPQRTLVRRAAIVR